MHLLIQRTFAIVLLLLAAISTSEVQADGGWYLGAGAGLTSLELDVPGSDGNVFGFDEDDTAWKVYGGYVVDLPLIDLGVEGGYVDFGNPSALFPGFRAEAQVTGVNVWGIAGVDVGPVGLFGKLGAIAWDLDGQTTGSVDQSFGDSGADLGYGLGAKFMLFSLEVRAEYERYKIADNVDMLSLGVNWVF